MRRALVAAVLLLGCAACQDTGPAGTGPGSSGSVEQELGGIESTLDNVESELAGD
ncbi:hypothetical protein [Actinokineospora terrae]|uniref:Uncharacterized protein n=1 Tax=Actinokineospora terrae TaxID=155974 RepID=A0A1H9VW19_9PSEU|nr:hypothetical protein [Actinokineospora terrae]SES25718.1 hypothetical protein SAMN04487818_109122 [Actinokineospora terrae]